MWFWLSLIALLFWSGSDLFSKLGCQAEDDRLSHLKMLSAVGLVMGLHALWSLLSGSAAVSLSAFLTYLPVSLLYISSMAIGYLGLRYIELSISSPICNSSGAIVAILCLVTRGFGTLHPVQLAATALICAGVVALGIVEAREDDALRAARQDAANRRYAKSWLALALPIIYCLLDALGTFADSLVLEQLSEDSANAAYELTFFAVGLLSFCYVRFVRKSRFLPRREAPKYAAALCETVGQTAYIYALADGSHVALSAPIISCYCVLSVLWGRLFLKEKLSLKHYACILAAVIGIGILGFFDA